MTQIIPNHMGDTYTWVGVVEDRRDPLQLGRVRVRIFGYHTTDTTQIPTEELPWASCVMPYSASIGGVGAGVSGYMIGSIVTGFWLDGSDMQMPAVLGTITPIEGVLSGDGGLGSASIGNPTIGYNGIYDNANNVPGNLKFSGTGPVWYQLAQGEIGTKEIVGGRHNPRILEYLRVVGLGGGDETPWCSAFAAWVFKNSGLSISGITGMARSWSRASCVERIETPRHGCITVFSRGSDPRKGHVAFFDSIQGGEIIVLGGNQSDQVKKSGYAKSRLVGFYWPKGYAADSFEPTTFGPQ